SSDRGGYRKSDSGERGGFRRDDSGDRGGYRGSSDRGGYRKDDSGDRGGYRGSSDRGGYRKSDSGERGGFRGERSGDRGGFRRDDSGDRGGYRGDRRDSRSDDRGGYRSGERGAERGGYQRDDRRDERSRERAARFQERRAESGVEATGQDVAGAEGSSAPEVTSEGSRAGYRLGDGAAATRAAAGREQGAEAGDGAASVEGVTSAQSAAADDADGVTRDSDQTADQDSDQTAGREGDREADPTADETADQDADPEAGQAADRDADDRDTADERGTRSGDREADDRAQQRDDRDDAPAPRGGRPELPEEADLSLLDPEIKAELRSLPKGLAEIVGRHLAAAGLLIDEEPELALEHARYARSKAARVGVVREAAGLTAYFADEWAEALSELRAARRMMPGPGHLAIMADCERALGRPERAIDLAKDPAAKELSQEDEIELRIVAAGARRDMGQLDAAVVALQGPDLDPGQRTPYSARLFYAYADNLAAAGRIEEAVKWFLNAAEADDEGETDAAERAFELTQEETAEQ
ncbi:hypothetical protein, partial [Lentzea aerocolonigenes]